MALLMDAEFINQSLHTL